MSASMTAGYVFDDELVIETPERVSLYFVLASVGNRFLAAAIDHAIQLLLLTCLVFLQHYAGRNRLHIGISQNWIIAFAIVGLLVVYAGYFTLFETIWSGQTPGKRLMRLRVIRDDGRPVGFYEAFVRNLIRLLDMAPPISYSVGVVAIIFSPESKRVGDYAAGTVVIKERATEAPRLEEIEALSRAEASNHSAFSMASFKLDVRKLSVEEMHAIERFLSRRDELPSKERSDFAMRIARPLSSKLRIQPPEPPPEELLEAISRAHRIRARYRA